MPIASLDPSGVRVSMSLDSTGPATLRDVPADWASSCPGFPVDVFPIEGSLTLEQDQQLTSISWEGEASLDQDGILSGVLSSGASTDATPPAPGAKVQGNFRSTASGDDFRGELLWSWTTDSQGAEVDNTLPLIDW